MFGLGQPWGGLRARLTRRRTGLAVLLACGLAACGGGGGGGSSGSPPSSQPPNASIVFPTRVSYTDASTVHVRGVASGPNGVAAVSVNGVAATSSDGFAHWVATLPVGTGITTATVSVSDAAGNARSAADAVTIHNRGASIVGLRAMAVDAANGRVLAVDQNTNAVYALRASDGLVTAFSNKEHGVGADFSQIEDLVVDGTRNRALVVDWGVDALVAIDLNSGNRSAVSTSTGSGSATEFSLGFGVALDATSNRAFVSSRGNNAIVTVNLATGARNVASSASIGSGPSFVNPLGLVYDAVTSPASPRLLVADAGLSAIVAVDLSTGNRTVLSSTTPAGTGVALDQPVQVKLDAGSHRLLVLDGSPTRNALIAVDLVTGNRTVLADASTGSGALVSAPLALAFDPATARAYIAAYQGGEVVQVNLSTLGRTSFASSNVGSGTKLINAAGLVVEQRGSTPTSLLLTDQLQGMVLRLDLATGNRSVVSSASVGSGINLFQPVDLVMDTRPGIATPQALILDSGSGHAIVAVNLNTGTRTPLANVNLASPAAVQLRKLTLDAAANRVLVTDAGLDAVFALNLASGARSVLSDSTHGSGIAFGTPTSLVLDAVSGPSSPRILVADAQQAGLIAVSPTGDRSLFASSYTSENILLPGAMVLDVTNQRVLLTDIGQKNLMSVNLANGNRTRLSGSNYFNAALAGTGPSLEFPSAMDADLPRDVAFIVAADRQAVMAVDLVTGDRVIVSH